MRGNVQQSVENIAIIEGDTTHKVIDFSTGELAVTITRNGELSDASVRVYHAGTNEQVAAGRTYRGAKTNPRKFRITPESMTLKSRRWRSTVARKCYSKMLPLPQDKMLKSVMILKPAR